MTDVRQRPRLVWLLVALVLLAVPVVVTVVVQRTLVGCCGPSVAYGEIWYCLEPDSQHPVGDVFLLTTAQVDKQVGQTRQWPDRIETGHVGTPLRWKQPAGAVNFALNLDPTGPNDSGVDERQSATVREGDVTTLLVDRQEVDGACPAAPTQMATPNG